MSDKVQPMPARKPLPPEIAAIAIPQEGDVPLVYINEAEEEPRGIIPLLRPDVYVPLFVGFVAERLSRLFREHAVAATAVVSVAATVAVATGASMILNRDRQPIAHPPVTVTAPAGPPVTVTATPTEDAPTPDPTTPEPSAEPSTESTRRAPDQATPLETIPPVASPSPPEPQPKRTRRRADPTPAPSAATSEPTLRRDAGPGDGPGGGAPSPEAEAAPPSDEPDEPDVPASSSPSEPGPQPELEPDGQERSCAVRVDVDPLLDLCLLG